MGTIYCYVKETGYSMIWVLHINKSTHRKLLDDLQHQNVALSENRIKGIFCFLNFIKLAWLEFYRNFFIVLFIKATSSPLNLIYTYFLWPSLLVLYNPVHGCVLSTVITLKGCQAEGQDLFCTWTLTPTSLQSGTSLHLPCHGSGPDHHAAWPGLPPNQSAALSSLAPLILSQRA